MTMKGTFTGKGSLRRPTDDKKFGDNFDRIFKRKDGNLLVPDPPGSGKYKVTKPAT